MAVRRLLIVGTRGRWGRLVGIIAGVAVGVLLALLLVAGANALETRDIRSSWLQPTVTDIVAAADDDIIAAPSRDTYRGDRIHRLGLAAPAGSLTTTLGIDAPAPGSFLASPALTALMADAPPSELQDRYGQPAGPIPAELLASPDSLVVVVGGTIDEVSALSSAGVVESFGVGAFGGNDNYRTLALVGALALLIPAFLLVAVSTTLGAAARSEQWQTLRTIGASRKLIRQVALTEAAGTAVLGAALGVGGFFALRPVLGLVPVAGERLVASDLTVSVTTILLVVGVVIAGSIIAAARSARAAESNANAQTVLETTPSLARLVPLLAGLGMFFLVNGFADQIPIALALPVVGSFVLLAVGLLVAGPVFTSLAGRVFARFAHTGDAVIASRRIVRTPRAGFRSVAGLVASTFVITVFAFSASAQVSAGAFSSEALLPDSAMAAYVASGSELTAASVDDHLGAVPGVEGVSFTYSDGNGLYMTAEDVRLLTRDTSTSPILELVGGVFSLAPEGPPLVETAVTSIEGMNLSDIVVRTDGQDSSLEAARTALLTLEGVDRSSGATTRAEFVTDADSVLATQFAEIGRLAIVIVTLLAAAVLAIATMAALYDRKRTFGLLQLIGMPRSTLRKITSWETVVPLLSILVPTVLLGWFTALMLITSLSDRALGWPDPLLAVSLTATGVMVAISIVLAARVGDAITRPSENVRRE